MPQETPEWEKQYLKNEPKEEKPILDLEVLGPYQKEIGAVEKELANLDNFLTSHFGKETKPQRSDFVELAKNLDVLGTSNFDTEAASLSEDILDRILVYMADRLKNQPEVMGKILVELRERGESEALEQIYEYVKTLHLKIIENKKKVLWLLSQHIGIKKVAAIFQEQEEVRERAYGVFLEQIKQNHKKEDEEWLENLENDNPDAIKTARLIFNNWYENHKIMFFSNYEKVRAEAKALIEKMDDKRAYGIIERRLSTTPQEIFELFESQAHISSVKKMAQNKKPDSQN